MACRPFLILGPPRSGSTLLAKSLDTHPEIFCAGEIFRPYPALTREERRFFGLARSSSRAKILESFLLPRNGVWGAKATYRHLKTLTAEERRRLLAGCRILHLRRNAVALSVSLYQAWRTGVWHLYEGAVTRPPPSTAVAVPPEWLRETFSLYDWGENEVERQVTEERRYSVSYRSLCEDFALTVDGIQRWLAVRVVPLAPATRRIRPGAVPVRASNFSALQDLYRGTAWEGAFRECLVCPSV